MPWDSGRLLQQLELGEDSRVEFKEAVFADNRVREPHRDAIADELAAFGNTIGGTLIFSVSDDGTVRSMNRQQMDVLEACVSEICADSIRPPLAFVTQRLALPGGSFVLVVEVEQSALVHKSPKGYLSRQGSSKRELSSEALHRLFQQRGRSGLFGPDESIVSGTGPNTLDPPLVDRFLSSRAIEPTTVQLTKLGLVREDDSGVTRATVASILRMLTVGDIDGAGDRQYFLEQRGEGVPIIYEQTRELTGREPDYALLDGAELRLTIPSARPPVTGIEGEVAVSVAGQPLAGANVLALYPNKTWMAGTTDTFGRVAFEFHSELPITVFCAAPGHGARVERDWRPPEPLSVQLETLPLGGSAVFTESTGHLPNLVGRLNPILDSLDRMYLYATNVAIDAGEQQPVRFKLHQSLRLTDINGFEWSVRFIEMIGTSALLEYEPSHHTAGQ